MSESRNDYMEQVMERQQKVEVDLRAKRNVMQSPRAAAPMAMVAQQAAAPAYVASESTGRFRASEAAADLGGAPAPRWWLAIVGVLGIGAGILTFLWPGITGLVLLFFIAGWAIAIGIFQIIGAIRLRKEIDNEWLLILSGIVSVLFGIGVLIVPGAGALALVWVIGLYAIVEGVLYIGLAFRLKKHVHA